MTLSIKSEQEACNAMVLEHAAMVILRMGFGDEERFD